MKHFKRPSFSKIKELSIIQATVISMLMGISAIIVAALAIQVINYVIIVSALAWIPYIGWRLLIVYYARKDRNS